MDTDPAPNRRFRPPAVAPADLDRLRANLAAAREAAGLNRQALCRAAGLSPAAVGLIEDGRSAPSLGTLLALSRALNLPLAELAKGLPAGGKNLKKNASRA